MDKKLSENSNNNNNNNNNNDKAITPASSSLSAEKARKHYMAEQELAQFAKLYFARVPEEQICQALKISRATYYRYLQKLAIQQQELLDEHLLESTYAEIGSLRNTLRFVEIHLRNILNNKDSVDTDKIEAAQLLCEVAWASVKLHTQGPIQTMKEMPHDLRNKLKDAAENNNNNNNDNKSEVVIDSSSSSNNNATDEGSPV